MCAWLRPRGGLCRPRWPRPVLGRPPRPGSVGRRSSGCTPPAPPLLPGRRPPGPSGWISRIRVRLSGCKLPVPVRGRSAGRTTSKSLPGHWLPESRPPGSARSYSVPPYHGFRQLPGAEGALFRFCALFLSKLCQTPKNGYSHGGASNQPPLKTGKLVEIHIDIIGKNTIEYRGKMKEILHYVCGTEERSYASL